MEELKKFLNDTELKHLIGFFINIKKRERNSYPFVFLSKRFYLLYCLLLKSYPEIELCNCKLVDNIDLQTVKEKIIYINDIPYELPKKIKINDMLYSYININHLYMDIYHDIPNITHLDIKKSQDYRLFNVNKFKFLKNRFYSSKLCTSHMAIEFINKEIIFLNQNGVSNCLQLLPDFLYNYFYFNYTNKEHLAYFLREFYVRRFLYKGKVADRVYCKLSDYVISDMVKKFGRANISENLIDFLSKNEAFYELIPIAEDMTKYNANFESELEEQSALKRSLVPSNKGNK